MHNPLFSDARLGLFIHWGLYAIGGWHEQEQWRLPVARRTYARRLKEFNPVRFDPDAWLDLAEAARMRYVCITAKHCDGFCLWHSDATEYHVGNTPFKRDILAELADACRRRGLVLCIYYSIPDLHHPAYPHAGRPYELSPHPRNGKGDPEAYLAYLRAQVTELCTRYGPLGAFWWDANVWKHTDPSVNELVRSLQPGILINNRGFDPGDYGTPERDWDASVDTLRRFPKPTEACQSVGLYSWGWKTDEDYYSDAHLQRSIAKVLAKGGNYLLNVGPQADGSIPDTSAGILQRLGAWLDRTGEAFFDAVPASELTSNPDVLLTRRGDALYVILHEPPRTNSVNLKPLGVVPQSAVLLNTGAPVETLVNRVPGYGPGVDAAPVLRLRNLPVNKLPGEVLVARLDFAPGDLNGLAGALVPAADQREFAATAG